MIAHGEGGSDLDALEASGLAELLGDAAPTTPVLTLTPHIGATEAAVGPLSAGLALEVMRTGTIPGALNRENPIEEFAGPSDRAASQSQVQNVLISITTREGINAAIVLKAGS